MKYVLDFLENLFLDAFASIRGFLYGFLVISTAITIIVGMIYLFLTIKNFFS